MKRKIGALVASAATVGALASTTVMMTVSVASASTLPPNVDWDHVYSAPGVRVYVEEHGDYIGVCDTSANGYPAWVAVGPTPAYSYKMTVTSGSGTCTSHDASDGGVYDLMENAYVDLEFDGEGRSFQDSSKTLYLNDH